MEMEIERDNDQDLTLLILRLVFVLTVVGFFVFLFNRFLNPRIGFWGMLWHLLVLVGFSVPSIYFIAIRPLIKERDKALQKLSEMAFHDYLTALPNRRYLYQHLEKTISWNLRHGIFGSVMVVDLDDFKKINDTYGHEAGDALLVEVGRRIKLQTRKEDMAARLGGDEFALLTTFLGHYREVALYGSREIAERVRSLIAKPFEFKGQTLSITCGIGITVFGDKEVTPEELIQQADFAMYQAKKDGIKFYTKK